MKRIISTLLVCVLLVGCVFSLAACGKKLSGTYKDPTGNVSYKFSGSKVTKTTDNIIGDDTVVEGKYSIEETEDGKFEITIEFEGEDAYTVPFSEGEENGEKYIWMGLVKYTKAK